MALEYDLAVLARGNMELSTSLGEVALWGEFAGLTVNYLTGMDIKAKCQAPWFGKSPAQRYATEPSTTIDERTGHGLISRLFPGIRRVLVRLFCWSLPFLG